LRGSSQSQLVESGRTSMCALGQKWVLRNDRFVLSTRRSA